MWKITDEVSGGNGVCCVAILNTVKYVNRVNRHSCHNIHITNANH